MKTVTRQKPFDEIYAQLEKGDPVFIVGCGTCATVFQTGGVEQVMAMEDSLKNAGFLITGWTVVPTACDEMTSASVKEKETAISNASAILSMSCAFGVQRLTMYLSKPVYPALDTLFMGLEEYPGYYIEACAQCGQCVLGFTAGVCPLTACHKGLLNGPCGGTNRGKCEVDSEKDCAFTLIYNRLKAQNRTDLMKIYHPSRNAQIMPRPRVQTLDVGRVESGVEI